MDNNGGILKGNAQASLGAQLIARSKISLAASAENFWKFICYRRPRGCDCEGCREYRRLPAFLHEHAQALIRCRNAFVVWEEAIPNIVVTEGKNDLLTQYLKGSGYTATWYVGLVDNAGFSAYAAGDTAAQIGGTNGWSESTAYSNANRVTWTGGTAAAGSIDNSASPAAFNINGTATLRGGFLISNNTKGGTTGVLYGEADYTGGNRSVLSGDTLNVTVTATV